MEYDVLERIVKEMQALATEAVDKRKAFAANGRQDMAACAANESVGIGKCLGVLVKEFPAEMEVLTAPAE